MQPTVSSKLPFLFISSALNELGCSKKKIIIMSLKNNDGV
jgi:hypothetical protein